MSKLNRKQLRKMLLKEFKMIGMANPHVGMIGHSPYQDVSYAQEMVPSHEIPGEEMGHARGHKGTVSMEDCCKAVLCLIECCDCEVTKQKIRECCDEILASC